VIPIVTPTEMAAIDAAAVEPVAELIERAGAAVEREAVDLLGGTYGRRVNIVAGPGNNGADGHVAARRLRRRGVKCSVFTPYEATVLPPADLLIDAAFGTGLSRPYMPPTSTAPLVLAVDIPSGVDGLTGTVIGEPMMATRTVTFAALKPGLLMEPGASLAGEVVVADIGLDVSGAAAHLVTDDDVAAWWPRRRVGAHKWHAATWVIGGSAGMTGAPTLAALGAQRAGAGYVQCSIPGAGHSGDKPVGADSSPAVEVVGRHLPAHGWASDVVSDGARFSSLVVGPGLGRSDETLEEVVALVRSSAIPLVVDADGLAAFANITASTGPASVVLTPHDGEFRMLTGQAPDADRFRSARSLAAGTNSTVLLKGPTTIVAGPDGRCLAVTSGDARLASAGTGDVLAGMIGALLAEGLSPLPAAALAAHVHGRAASRCPIVGTTASDVARAIPAVLDAILTP